MSKKPRGRGRGRGRGAPIQEATFQYRTEPASSSQYTEHSRGGESSFTSRGSSEGRETTSQRTYSRRQHAAVIPEPSISSLPRQETGREEIFKQETKPSVSTGAISKKELSSASTPSLEQQLDMVALGDSNVKIQRARRLGRGTAGRRINLIGNFFQLSFKNSNIYHYDVDIIPLDVRGDHPSLMKAGNGRKGHGATNIEQEEKRNIGKEKCRQILFQLLKENRHLQQYSPVYDGQKTLFTSKKIPINDLTEFPISIRVNNRMKRFNVLIQPVVKKNSGDNIISLKTLPDYIAGNVAKVPDDIRMVFDTILSHRNPPFDQVVIGRSFFFKNTQTHNLGSGSELWMGYNQSVRFTERGPAVLINLAAAAFYKSGPVLDYASDILRRPIERQPLNPYEIKKLSKAISNVRVQVTHMKVPRKYPVKGLTNVSAREMRFPIDENGKSREVTIEQYFKERYSVKLKFPHLPCLHMRTTNNKVFIPMEVCVIPAGQRMQSLEGPQTAQMIRKTAIRPRERFDHITNDAATVSEISHQQMNCFGLAMSLKPMEFPGRVLDKPAIQYCGGNANSKVVPNEKGVWDMRRQQFIQGVSIKKWMIVSFASPMDCTEENIKNFAKLLRNTGSNSGFNIDFPEICNYSRSSTEDAIKYAKKQKVDLLLVVLSNKDYSHSYDEVKFLADIKYELVTQCVDKDVVVQRANGQVASNLCLKINLKLGGINHVMSETHPFLQKETVIIFGADVVHGVKGSNAPSIAAVVACTDNELSKYAVSCCAQTNPIKSKESQEIILNLKKMVTNILRSFRRSTNKKPTRILFYRDGVSEGQFQHVLEREVPMIKDACKSLQADYQPPITFTIVQKRHQFRMVPKNRNDGVGSAGNVPAGTTVDTDVVDPFNFDFYLCSHEGIQGTSKPAHYTVLFNENRLDANEMQSLSYYLCHVYARCNRSISIPAPVKYADLLAYRVKKYIDIVVRKSVDSSSYGSHSESDAIPDEVVDLLNSIGDFKHKMFFL